MPTISKDQAEAIALGIMFDMPGEPVDCSNAVRHVAVYPQSNSEGVRASMMIIRPGGALWMRPLGSTSAANPTTTRTVIAAAPSAKLAANTDYVIPLHPSVNTLGFIAVEPTGTSGWVNWVIGG